MSSISSSDRSQQNDEIRQAREDYTAQEAETAKRNRAERKRMQEVHDQELERLKGDYDRQLSAVRNKNKDVLTERDQEHQDQIDKVKSLYMDQVRKKTEENESARSELRRSFDTDLDKEKRVDEQQKSSLSRNFKDSLNERDRQFGDFQENAQKTMHNAITDRTQKLNEKHEKELGLLRENRDDRIADLEQRDKLTRSTLSGQLKDEESHHARELSKMNEHWHTISKDQANENDSLLSNRDALLSAERASMRERYKNATENKIDELQTAHDNLKAQTESRMDSQVRSLSHDLEQSKSDRTIDMITQQRISDLEKHHLQEAETARMDDLEKQRTQMNDVLNSQAREKIGEAQVRNDKLLQTSTRDNRMKSNLQSLQSREDRAQLQLEMQSRLENANDQADKRVRRIVGATNEEVKAQQKYQDQSLDQLKSNYADNLSAQRDVQLDTIQKMRVRDEERMHQQDLKATKKVEDVSASYEAKIQKIQEDSQGEKSRIVDAYEQRISQHDKAAKTELESQAIKYEGKLAQADELRQKEIERLERRHQEQMADLANRTKYLNKKA